LALAESGFVLGVRPVSGLLPHERIIPANVQRLASEVVKDGVQKDPIIIDKESAAVLDGMHRLAAFGTLDIENVVCCSVDYSSKTVSLKRWARVYSIPRGEALSRALGATGVSRRVTLAEAFDSLDQRKSGVAILTSDAAYLPYANGSLEHAFAAVDEFDSLSERDGWKRQFVPEDDIDIALQESRNSVVLVWRLTKDDVVTAAKTGRLFPCKTSMHVIDPRPVAVNFPIEELKKATSAALQQKLGGRVEKLMPPGSVYEGRRYKERLLLLNSN
jgi:hypothetical protein